MNYTNIKKILRKQIENAVNTFWTFDEEYQEFTCIYKDYDDSLQIFTPQQLLDKLESI